MSGIVSGYKHTKYSPLSTHFSVLISLLFLICSFHTSLYAQSSKNLSPGYDYGDISVNFTQLEDSSVREIDFPLKLNAEDLTEYRVQWEEGAQPTRILGLTIRGEVNTNRPIQKVMYTLDNGKTWHHVRGKKNWSIFLSQKLLKEAKKFSITVMAWTEYGQVSEPVSFGPIHYQTRPFPPKDEPIPETPVHPLRKKKMFTGLVYPGVTVGFQSDAFTAEMRFLAGDGQKLWGPRVSYFIYPYQGGNVYTALDLFVADFEGDLTVGQGWMIGGVGGVQHYLGDYMSLTLDIGPYWIRLEDDLSGLEVQGFEYVINSGVNLHFY